MFPIKFWSERHGVVLDIVADVTFETDCANFSLGIGRQTAPPAGKSLGARSRGGNRQRRHQIWPRKRHRLHDLTAERKTDGMASCNAEMRQQRNAILNELRHRVTIRRPATLSSAAAVKSNGLEY